MNCSSCKRPVEPVGGMVFCPYCGERLDQQAPQRPTRLMPWAVLIAALVIVLGGGAALMSGHFPLPLKQPASTLSLPDLLERVQPSIVLIETANVDGARIAQGSGVAIRDNLVLTNAHVVHGAAAIKVVTADGTAEGVEIQNWDLEHDIALIRVNAKLRPVAVGDSNGLRVGERVMTLGSPMGFAGSASEGIVSGRREIEQLSMIQFTAPISPGSSGGGLFNTSGQLVGITTAQIEGGQNLNLAVPAEQATTLVGQTALAKLVPGEQRWVRSHSAWSNLLRYSQALGPVQSIDAEHKVSKGNNSHQHVVIHFDRSGREISYDSRGSSLFDRNLTYHYDQSGRLTRVSDDSSTTAVRYDQDGTAFHYRDSAPQALLAEDYDGLGRLVRMYTRWRPDQKLEMTAAFTYEAAGVLSKVSTYYNGSPETIKNFTYGRYSTPLESTDVRVWNNYNDKVTTAFTNYRYDHYGNWISRDYREVRDYNDYIEEGTETRTITYYTH